MACRIERSSCFVEILTFILSVTAAQLWAAESPKPLKVLIVTGGCCHDYPVQKELLKKGLESRAFVDVETVYQGGAATDSKIPLYEKDGWADGFDVIIHDECFADVKDNAWTSRILKPHRAGLPAVVLHCAMHCYRDGTNDWFEFCGVTSHGHGAHYPHEVLTRNAEHPIMRTLGAGWFNPAGELYHIDSVGSNATLLASAKSRELANEHVVAWVNEYGPHKTRVFGSTLGHHNVTVEHPAFLDLVTRGTLWACGKLNDDYLRPKTVQKVPVNLARGMSATASSEESNVNRNAGKAFDGDPGTRWCASSSGFPQFLQVDLGKPQQVTGIDLKWEFDQPYTYQLHGSIDGTTWTPLADRSNTDQRHDHEDLSANVRYLKLIVTGNKQGGWASVSEFAVNGTETVTIVSASTRAQADQAVLADVQVPKGFDATVFAAPPAVIYPVFVASSPDGVVYVSVDKNGSLDREPKRGAIYRLRDLDGDGKADETKLFVADVDSPRGLVWDRDRLYVMHPPHLSAFIDKDLDGIADEEQILVKGIAFDFKDRPADHTSNGVTLGIDGWLYLAIGDFGFMQAEATDGRKLQFRGGGVVRVRPDGSGIELYSRGTRNILEVGVDPLLNGFTRDNTNDGDGWDIRLHHFTGMENHGYPSFFKNFSDEIVQPLADYGGGSGCGGCYIDEPGFPDGSGNAMYTADWGRNWVYRHRMTPNGATFKADQTEFVGLTRVTDLDVDANSHIFVTSWKGATFTYNGEDVGYLIRLTPQGYQPAPLTDFAKAPYTALVADLREPSHRRRLAAERELVARGLVKDALSELIALASDQQATLPSRIAAVYTLTLGGHGKTVAELDVTKNAELLPWILKSLSETIGTHAVAVPTSTLQQAMKSANPRTRLEAVIATTRWHRQEAANDVVGLLVDPDPIVAHTAFQSLVKLDASELCFAVVDRNDAEPAQREAAFRVLRQLHEPVVVQGLIQRLKREPEPGRRKGLLTALCRLHQQEGTWKGASWGTRPDSTGPYYQPETWDQSERIAEVLKASLEGATPEEAAHLLTELNRHKVSLDGALDRMIEMATKDPTMVPTAIVELTRSATVPTAAISLLRKVVEQTDAPIEQRVTAMTVWLRAKDQFPVILPMIPQIVAAEQTGERSRLWSHFLKTDLLGLYVELLRQSAADAKSPVSLWADAGLLALVSPKHTVSPEIRAVAQKTIDEMWMQEGHRLRILQSLRSSNQREHSKLVKQSLTDTDPQVANLANEMAQQWRLNLSPTPIGPKLETLKPEDVVAAVLKLPGTAGQGETLFSKMNCSKCHTVKADEPLRGPYLPNVAKTYKRDQLAESILLPSKSLAQGFVTYIFALNNGKSIAGFVTAESADEVTIRDIEGKEIKLRLSDIEERTKSNVSVMPEGLAKDLTIEEFASLLAYLESLGK